MAGLRLGWPNGALAFRQRTNSSTSGLSTSYRHTAYSSSAGTGSTSDHLVQVSAGYGFENGIDVSAGYAHVREADLDYDIIGLRLTKSFEFTSRK